MIDLQLFSRNRFLCLELIRKTNKSNNPFYQFFFLRYDNFHMYHNNELEVTSKVDYLD